MIRKTKIVGGFYLSFLATLLLVTPNAQAQIGEVTVEKEGVGSTKKSAIMDAIKEALIQVNGASVAASTMSTISEASRTSANKENYESSASMSKKISIATKGLIKSYQIKNIKRDPGLGNLYVANLIVKISKFKTSAQLKRLRLSVPNIFIKHNIRNARSKSFANDVKSKLIDFLTQTRRFAIMDREFGEETKAELNRIKGDNFKSEELARLGNQVGVDYIVLPTLNNYYITKKVRVSKLSGKKSASYDGRADLSIKIIDVATSQIKFSKNMRVPTTSQDLAHLSTKVARTSSDIIINAIMPPQVISLQGDLLVINQGGDAIAKGRRYKVVALGKRLFDPYTKESLGREEIDAAIIEIVGSTDRTSTARIVKKITIKSVSAVLKRVFIIRPIFGFNSGGMKKKINIDAEEKSINKRINKMKAKSKDDW